MTKIDGRDKSTEMNQINDSLKRLQTDRIDLLQFHEVIRDSDPGRTFAAGGVLEAAESAKKAGKVRYIGFTGHKSPDIHLLMLSTASAAHGFTFDTVHHYCTLNEEGVVVDRGRFRHSCPAHIPAAGSAGGPPLPSAFREFGGGPFDLRALFTYVDEHPDDLPRAMEWIQAAFSSYNESQASPPKPPWEH